MQFPERLENTPFLTCFCLFFDPLHLILTFMNYELAFLNSYPPLIFNAVCERPLGAGAGTNAHVR